MRETIEIGATPHEENCAQVGTDTYEERSYVEARAFKAQLTRMVVGHLGDAPMPETFRLHIKSNDHDFGTYREVCVSFDDRNESAVDLAYWVEGNAPAHWDAEALRELNS